MSSDGCEGCWYDGDEATEEICGDCSYNDSDAHCTCGNPSSNPPCSYCEGSGSNWTEVQWPETPCHDVKKVNPYYEIDEWWK